MTKQKQRVIKLNNGKFVPQVSFLITKKNIFGKKKETQGPWWNILSGLEIDDEMFLEFSSLEDAKNFLNNPSENIFEEVYISELIEN